MLVGIDVGGTNIDGVLIENKKIIKTSKNHVDRDKLFETIKSTLLELLEGIDPAKIERINLSTTISTNAIVEDKIDRVLMILQGGPGIKNNFEDTLENIVYINGYVDHRGKVVKDFDPKIIKDLKGYKDLRALGVVSKFSTRNPDTENLIGKSLEDNFDYISLGHTMSGQLNYPRRVYTTYLNSAVSRTFSNFVEMLEKSLIERGITAPVFILKADGGTMTLKDSLKKPVESILSGPAASFMGISALENTRSDSIYIDIGGTTTDIFFLVDGLPLYEEKGIEINGLKTLVKGIYSRSIGLGGDSSIEIKEGRIKIGPERKDRPAALLGKYPTLTDALVSLDLLDLGNNDLAIKAIETLGENLKVNYQEISKEVIKNFTSRIYEKVRELLEEINSKPLFTVKEVLENRKILPEEIILIGGPAKVLRPFVEERFSIRTRVVDHYEIANAIGACLSRPTLDLNLHADTKRRILSIPEGNIYKEVSPSFTLENGIDLVREVLKDRAKDFGEENREVEILEANSFNMVDNYIFGKNIRIKGQLRPELIYNLWGDNIEG